MDHHEILIHSNIKKIISQHLIIPFKFKKIKKNPIISENSDFLNYIF